MCLVLVAIESHPDYALVVAANRDEFYERPTAPARFWPDAPTILAGRDLQAGGTWLGIARQGRFAAVTNYRQGQREPAAPRSRGRLASEFLRSGLRPREYVQRTTREADLYNGFNLLVGYPGELHYFSNREGRARRLAPGVYGLSNHLLDTAWPKVASSKRAFETLLASRGPELVTGLLSLLGDRTRPPDHTLPRTGIDSEWERLLSSAFIESDRYGTRSSTVVLVSRDGLVEFVERGFGPHGAAGGEVRIEFQLDPTAPAAS